MNKIISKLEIYLKPGRWNERSRAVIEENIFVSAYIIRKLLEAKKLSFELNKLKIKAEKFSNLKRVDHMNWHKIEELFDLTTPKKNQLRLNYLCNIIIHSFIFMLCYNDNNSVHGFFITSDYTRNDELYLIELKDYIAFLKVIAKDGKWKSRMIRNAEGDWIEVDPDNEKLTAAQEKGLREYFKKQHLKQGSSIYEKK